MNGLGDQSAPTSRTPIAYPFRSFAGRVAFGRERWGDRGFDMNRDGVANYGLHADWLQELRLLGGRPLMSDLFRGSEAYLETWERRLRRPGRTLPDARRALDLRRARPLGAPGRDLPSGAPPGGTAERATRTILPPLRERRGKGSGGRRRGRPGRARLLDGVRRPCGAGGPRRLGHAPARARAREARRADEPQRARGRAVPLRRPRRPGALGGRGERLRSGQSAPARHRPARCRALLSSDTRARSSRLRATLSVSPRSSAG